MRWIATLLVIISILGTGFSASSHLYAVEHHDHQGLHMHITVVDHHTPGSDCIQPDGQDSEHVHFNLMAPEHSVNPELITFNASYHPDQDLPLISLRHAPPLPPPEHSLTSRA